MKGSQDNAATMEAATARQTSFYRSFARWLLVVALVPALIFGLAYSWLQYRAEYEQLRGSVASTARQLGSSIDEYLANHLSAVTMLADTMPAGSASEGDMTRLQRRYPAFYATLATDRTGRVRLALPEWKYPSRLVATVADRDYFFEPQRTGEAFVSNALRSRDLTGENIVVVSAPLRRNGEFDGILAGSIAVKSFTAMNAETLGTRKYEMLLVDRAGSVLFASERFGYPFLQQIRDTPFAKVVAELEKPDGGPVMGAGVLVGGGDALFAQARMRNGWTLYVGAPRSLLVNVLFQRILLMAVLLLLSVAGVIVASRYQMRRMRAANDGLLEILHDYALGRKVDVRRASRLPTELNPLVDAIVAMSTRLNDAYQKLNVTLEKQRELTSQREQEVQARTAELRNAVAELDRMTRIDPLTGAFNVRALHERIAEPMAMLKTATRVSIGVLVLDVDYFKGYNDRYGHPAGDTLLKRVVGLIRSALRDPSDEVIRSGGEEFVVLVPSADLESALIVAQRICEAVRGADIAHAGSSLGHLTVSIGVAVATADTGLDLQVALAQADEALYRAKGNGRDRFSV